MENRMETRGHGSAPGSGHGVPGAAERQVSARWSRCWILSCDLLQNHFRASSTVAGAAIILISLSTTTIVGVA